MKNVVFIHLESLSTYIFDLNREIFVNLNNAMNIGRYYTNYYATATSTAMVINDITYADHMRIESTKKLSDIQITHENATSLIDELEEKGYQTLGVHWPYTLGNEVNPGHMYAKNKDLENYNDYKKSLEDVKGLITRSKEKDTPFLIYYCNEVSHISYTDIKKKNIQDPIEKWSYGYKSIDDTIKDIISILKTEQVYENTTIIIYGDHGDDFYGHEFNGGFSHALVPYSLLTHTPLVIIDSEITPGICEDCIGSTDIKNLVYKLIDSSKSEARKRKYIFSRNFCAAQEPKKIPSFISEVRKGYSVCNKEFCLLISEDGLEMYMRHVDEHCSCNLLDFFKQKGKSIEIIVDPQIMFTHFRNFMTPGAISTIRMNYEFLLKALKHEIVKLEKEVKIKEAIPHQAFEHINRKMNIKAAYTRIRLKKYIWSKTK